ncbi:hypothetical protein [Streptomyces sp. NBC_00158]|uniref:hypothetical protein n=1 Tax=Streptomyces sp. NBC_00158 TaxID=2903627 RepID=UPI002F90B3E6
MPTVTGVQGSVLSPVPARTHMLDGLDRRWEFPQKTVVGPRAITPSGGEPLSCRVTERDTPPASVDLDAFAATAAAVRDEVSKQIAAKP